LRFFLGIYDAIGIVAADATGWAHCTFANIMHSGLITDHQYQICDIVPLNGITIGAGDQYPMRCNLSQFFHYHVPQLM